MMIHVPSNTTFANRKQAIKCMGKYIYDRELRKSNFVFINEKIKGKTKVMNSYLGLFYLIYS